MTFYNILEALVFYAIIQVLCILSITAGCIYSIFRVRKWVRTK